MTDVVTVMPSRPCLQLTSVIHVFASLELSVLTKPSFCTIFAQSVKSVFLTEFLVSPPQIAFEWNRVKTIVSGAIYFHCLERLRVCRREHDIFLSILLFLEPSTLTLIQPSVFAPVSGGTPFDTVPTLHREPRYNKHSSVLTIKSLNDAIARPQLIGR